MPYCPSCGEEINSDDEFCSACGSTLSEAISASSGRQDNQPAKTEDTSQHQQERPSAATTNQQTNNGTTRRNLLLFGGGIAALAGLGWFIFLNDGVNPPLDELNIRLVDIRTPDVGLTSATIPLIVEFENPTQESIPDTSGDLDIYINDTRIASEEIVTNRLEPGERTNVNIDLVAKYAEYGSAIVDAIRSQSFDVRISGSLNSGGASREVTLTGSI